MEINNSIIPIFEENNKNIGQPGVKSEKIKGIYVLFISVRKNIFVKVGALGKIKFSKGIYAYVGSAQNGIRERVTRHLGKEKRKFWHIDYLLVQKDVRIEKIVYQEAEKKRECRIAEAFLQSDEPVKGFGCSDCSCSSHLFKIKNSYIVISV